MSLCCADCFNDSILKLIIQQIGSVGDCHYCTTKGVKCVEANQLQKHFSNLASVYNEVGNFMPGEVLKDHEGVTLVEAIQENWELFNFDEEYHDAFLNDVFGGGDSEKSSHPSLDAFVAIEHEYWGDDDEFMDEMSNKWEEFCKEIKHGNRFFPTKSINLALLNKLLGHHIYNPNGGRYYRSRGCEDGVPKLINNMGAAPATSTPNGRANPHGISYLYLASDELTAWSETTNPKYKSYTIGAFELRNGLKLLDLRKPIIGSPFRYGSELGPVLLTFKYLVKLSEEISKPFDPDVAVFEYVPIQYLCENFKHEGYDGIVFKSSKGIGYNLVLFDQAKASILSIVQYDSSGRKI